MATRGILLLTRCRIFSLFVTIHRGFVVEKWFDTLINYGHHPESGDFGELVYRIVHMQRDELTILQDAVGRLRSTVDVCGLVAQLEASDTDLGVSGADSVMNDADWRFFDICTKQPWVIESALVVCGAALICAPDPGRVVGYYPAHTLHYVIRLLNSNNGDQDAHANTFLSVLDQLDSQALGKFRRALGRVLPGFGEHVTWPSPELCVELVGLAEHINEQSDVAMSEVVRSLRETTAEGGTKSKKKIPSDVVRRLTRMQYCFRDLSVVCRLLAQPCGWLRLLLYSKLCVLTALRAHVERQRFHEFRANVEHDLVYRRRVSEVADAVLWELAPLIRFATNSPFTSDQKVHSLFSDPVRKGTVAVRKRLQRGRERLLFHCQWMDRNAIIEPNSVLDGRDEGLLEELKKIRDNLWGAPV